MLLDSDLDRHLTNTWVRAPYAIEPDLIKDFDLELRQPQNGTWKKVAEVRNNHHRRVACTLEAPTSASALRMVIRATNGTPRAHVYEVKVLS